MLRVWIAIIIMAFLGLLALIGVARAELITFKLSYTSSTGICAAQATAYYPSYMTYQGFITPASLSVVNNNITNQVNFAVANLTAINPQISLTFSMAHAYQNDFFLGNVVVQDCTNTAIHNYFSFLPTTKAPLVSTPTGVPATWSNTGIPAIW